MKQNVKYQSTALLLVIYALLIGCKCLYFSLCISSEVFIVSFCSTIRILSTYAAFSMLLALCVFMRYNKYVSWVVIVLLDLWIVANLLYFRSYHDLLNIWCLDSVSQLSLYEGIIMPYLRLSDGLLVISSIAWVLISQTKRLATCQGRLSALSLGVSMMAIGLLFTPWWIAAKQAETSINPFAKYYHDVSMGRVWYATSFSVLAHGINEAISLPKRWQEQQAAEISDTLIDQYIQPAAPYIQSDYNVVVVLFESLESWVVDTLIQGQEITPNINRLIENSHTLFVKNVVPQTKMGRSADAQLISLTGLLPIENGVTCMRYANNSFPSLAEASKAKYKKMYVPTAASAWNQEAMTRAYGFDELYAQEVSDRTIISRLLSDISQKDSFFVVLTTMASHVPFTAYADSSSLAKLGADMSCDYLRAVNYTDACLGALIEYCTKEHSKPILLVVTGDHTTLDSSLSHSVPLLIYRSEQLPSTTFSEVKQIDIYPTLLYAMGCEAYYWKGLGDNIFEKTATTHNDVQELSSIIIRSDYFSDANKRLIYQQKNKLN